MPGATLSSEFTPTKPTVHLEINGQSVEASQGSMLIEAADAANIRIPRFCYHKKLSVAANCRMCLVEVEKAPKPLPACATPVTEGMKVFTHSPKAIAAQQAVMEFLLINHPLDCPICDQGGECELQDVSLGYGTDNSHYGEPKRAVPEPDLGPLIATEMTRCIHCTRCIRFGTEIAGVREIGAVGRGEHMRITNFVERVVASELSANVIDVCPVGALTSKPYRFQARAWELIQRDAIAPHDALGSHLHAHVRRGELMRMVPREAEELNETWISDRDRFSYQGLYSSDRQTEPLIKEKGVWKTVSWEEALSKALSGFQAIAASAGADQNGFLIHPSSTIEELFLFQTLARHLGSPHVDSRLRQLDFSADDARLYSERLNTLSVSSFESLESADCVLIVGSDLRQEQPLINARIRKATLNGARVFVINPMICAWNYDLASEWALSPQDLRLFLMELVRCSAVSGSPGVEPELFAKAALLSSALQEQARDLMLALKAAKNPWVISGAWLDAQPQAQALYFSLNMLTQVLNSAGVAERLHLPYGANAIGAALAGALPDVSTGGFPTASKGMPVTGMLQKPLKGYFLWNIEPSEDFLLRAAAEQAFASAEFVVLATPFVTESMLDDADVILPIAPLYETSGTLVNAKGDWQSFEAVTPGLGQSRPGWRVLRVLHNLAHHDTVQFMSSLEVKAHLQSELDKSRVLHEKKTELSSSDWPDDLKRSFDLMVERPEWDGVHVFKPYQIDSLVRRADALQAMPQSAIFHTLRIHPEDGQNKGFHPGDQVLLHQGKRAHSFQIEWADGLPLGTYWVDAEVLPYYHGDSVWIEKGGES